jgi:3-dehydroquinate synthase
MAALDRSSSGVVHATLSSLACAIDAQASVVVTDADIRGLYGPAFPTCPVVEAPAGEAAKEMSELGRLYEAFARLGLGRDGTVVAIGGGAVSDLAGFAAATWMRGVDFCAAPTTLLAMVDAALGGKNGVDLGGHKNVVGTFYPARLVLCDVSLLATLSDVQFASGMAEAIKHAIIEGGEHFAFLERECRSRASLDDARLDRLVRLSQAVKLGVVGRDAREAGERRVLNLGHTLGHAIESVSGLPHGHAVAAGIAAAFSLAARRGLRRNEDGRAASDAARVARLLEGWGLPASIEAARALALSAGGTDGRGAGAATLADDGAFRRAVAAAIGADKKRARDEVLFAMPRAIGDVGIESVGLDELTGLAMEAP